MLRPLTNTANKAEARATLCGEQESAAIATAIAVGKCVSKAFQAPMNRDDLRIPVDGDAMLDEAGMVSRVLTVGQGAVERTDSRQHVSGVRHPVPQCVLRRHGRHAQHMKSEVDRERRGVQRPVGHESARDGGVPRFVRVPPSADPAGLGSAVVGEERHDRSGSPLDSHVACGADVQALGELGDRHIETLSLEERSHVTATGVHHDELGADVLRHHGSNRCRKSRARPVGQDDDGDLGVRGAVGHGVDLSCRSGALTCAATVETVTRYLITGAAGMLGRDLQSALDGREVTALDRTSLDITDPDACHAAIAEHDVVINAAAYTAVDAAESDEGAARLVNALGAENLARASAAHGAVMVQLSTDYVFAGDAAAPYSEDAPLAPVSAYGRTKADGERLARAANPDATIVMRTAWLYGEHGSNFVSTMERLAGERETLTVVDDQRGQPTWTADLAAQIVQTLDAGVRSATLHGTSAGETTWFDFARAIFRMQGWDDRRVQPVSSADFVRPAPRPAYSVLGHEGWRRAGIKPIRPWEDALSDYLRDAR